MVQVSVSVTREVWERLLEQERAGVKSVGHAIQEALEGAAAAFTSVAGPFQEETQAKGEPTAPAPEPPAQ